MNDIRHWLRGGHVYRNGDEPPPGRPVQPSARGSFHQNCIQANREFGLLVSGLATVGMGFTGDLWVFMAASLIAGMGAGLLNPPQNAVVADVTARLAALGVPIEERPRPSGRRG